MVNSITSLSSSADAELAGGTVLYSLSAAPDIVDQQVDSPIAKKLREKDEDNDAAENGTSVVKDTAVEVAAPSRNGVVRARKGSRV